MAPGASRFLRQLLDRIERRAEEGNAFPLLLVGPPSGPTIETFSRRGARVTVDGDERPELPLGHGNEAFELILALDLIDYLDDEQAGRLGPEWARVLVPGGRVYMVSRSRRAQLAEGLRLEVVEPGSLVARPRQALTAQVVYRSNAGFDGLLAPLRPDEILLRRDGLREVIFKKPRLG